MYLKNIPASLFLKKTPTEKFYQPFDKPTEPLMFATNVKSNNWSNLVFNESAGLFCLLVIILIGRHKTEVPFQQRTFLAKNILYLRYGKNSFRKFALLVSSTIMGNITITIILVSIEITII